MRARRGRTRARGCRRAVDRRRARDARRPARPPAAPAISAGLGEVDRDARRRAADLTRDRLGASGVAARDDDGAAARGVALGERAADAGRAADDHDRALGHDATPLRWSASLDAAFNATPRPRPAVAHY